MKEFIKNKKKEVLQEKINAVKNKVFCKNNSFQNAAKLSSTVSTGNIRL
jgi:hypothetical protein